MNEFLTVGSVGDSGARSEEKAPKRPRAPWQEHALVYNDPLPAIRPPEDWRGSPGRGPELTFFYGRVAPTVEKHYRAPTPRYRYNSETPEDPHPDGAA